MNLTLYSLCKSKYTKKKELNKPRDYSDKGQIYSAQTPLSSSIAVCNEEN